MSDNQVLKADWRTIDISTKKGLRQLDKIINLLRGGSGNCVNCDYTTYLPIAIELWDDVPDDYTPRLVRMLVPRDERMKTTFKAHIMKNDLSQQFEAINDDPALAISLSWLELQEALGNLRS